MSEAVLTIKEVQTRTGYSRPSIYRLISEGLFPKQVALSTRKVVWRERDIDAWWAKKIGGASADDLEDLLA
ncbi:hypothetical protein AEAC466_04185 [Asticcacaulis sp. AC466]|uniref:helix-turn-helix transcriptional regulator n=1 Tax=Asticcacaulis sp. AC466 TaxID=1282362 RepID=UPI0003C3C840|nr:AlpA family phage regulatory protein [Asticcacaulis sp. AC466]ESQ85502.1 hypothetical protein AEAC466_04185 [Asticcacaulis sp. AC466]